ncbi:Uncharacterised protein [Mycobacteroides abscessus]|nr:Uncharacterised protein [Mycobacteroides abscessus]CPW46149.1 Uncharacterised protein [Mycobacteroides abscessus]CPW66436.1 Uncharacterised protein [Mycobacteroides abscessus]CQA11524.1 Uncharacterised protein [Mycobacteroides abscessus]
MPETTPQIPKYPPGLRPRGKRLWNDLHTLLDVSDNPETAMVIEQACYLADDIDRQRRMIRKAGTDTHVKCSQGQQVSMAEIADRQRNQQLLLSMLKSIQVDDPDGKLTRSDIGQVGAAARWH